MHHEDVLPGSEPDAARTEPVPFSLRRLTAACTPPAYLPVHQ
jgi:hypothetical protein